MKLPESLKTITIILLVIAGIALAGYLFDYYNNQKLDERNKLFREARDKCYDLKGHCDTIFEDLQKDLSN
jgi:hypothetical protein